jgi:rhodanese-related sulfurtransferase
MSDTNSTLIKQVTSAEVISILNSDNKVFVLDVRTAGEFNAGHVKDAIHIDINQSDALQKIDKLDHNATYVVHCRTNHRSKIAVDHMVVSGFKHLYHMMDGFNGWSQNRLPTIKE